MKFRIQLTKLFRNACMLALAVAATASSQTQAQHPIATATGQAVGDQPISFQYLFFWKENDARTQSVLEKTRNELAGLGANVSLKPIGIKDPANAEVVDFYGVGRAPMPLVLCTASNGAVTKAFLTPFPAEQLREGIVSPGTALSLKALQENKLVVLCAINSSTAESETALDNANALTGDQRFAASIKVIALDVRDPNEASLLAGVNLDSSMAEPTIVILAPPGKQLATLSGVVSTRKIAEKLIAAQNECCPGGKCGPGGQCCPGGKCEPTKK